MVLGTEGDGIRDRGGSGVRARINRKGSHQTLKSESHSDFTLPFHKFADVQDNYLLEIRGDVNSSLDPSNPQDETMDDETAADGDKVYYVVHPQVDLSDLSSSLPGV